MQQRMFCPSMMCVDYDHLADDIQALDRAGADSFHCDVMDGCFVPNMTMGIQDIKAVRRNTKKMVDVHLMIENPAAKVQWFIDAGADLIYIHPEAERYTVKTLQAIRAAGKLAGIAVNPDTSAETVKEMLNVCDYVMVMTVNPGFAGQSYIEFVTKKVQTFCDWKAEFGYKVVIDGSCSPERIKTLSAIGADGFVLGTAALFGKGRPYAEILDELRRS